MLLILILSQTFILPTARTTSFLALPSLHHTANPPADAFPLTFAIPSLPAHHWLPILDLNIRRLQIHVRDVPVALLTPQAEGPNGGAVPAEETLGLC